jgi:hypothetical protein
VLAFSASWVGSIPRANPPKDNRPVEILIDAFKALPKTNERTSKEERKKLRADVLSTGRFALGLKADSDAIVFLSKALHFFRPTMVPLIDENVGKAWDKVVARFPNLTPTSLMSGTKPKTKKGAGTERVPRPTTADYLSFWEVAADLVRVGRSRELGGPRFSYRDLDLLLFRIGKHDLALCEPAASD